jgi:hypothetical protein
MLTKKVLNAMLLFGCLFMLGCNASHPSQAELDKNWGRSYEMARFNQIVNQDAPENTDPITGLHGVAAMNNLDQYEKNFETEGESRPVINIDLSEGN